MQSDSSEKSDIQVRALTGNKAIRDEIQGLYGIECAERAPCIAGELELPVDLSRHYRLVIPVVHN